MRRITWLALALGIAVALVPMTSPSAARSDVRSSAQSPPHLYIMFLPGLCPWPNSDSYCHGAINATARAGATFRTLITQLTLDGVQYTPLYYSYDADHSTYTVPETHQALARSVNALDRQLRLAKSHDPRARFDLVGHSLGGVIAASWLATKARQTAIKSAPLLRSVHSIVTFDSPLRGVHQTYIAAVIAQIFGGAVWANLRPSGSAIRAITSRSSAWWRSNGHLHSVANTADLVVPPSEAILGVSRLVTDRQCSQDILLLHSCHGAVLADVPLNHFVACTWVTTSTQCRQTPTPTPIPTATPTSTPNAAEHIARLDKAHGHALTPAARHIV